MVRHWYVAVFLVGALLCSIAPAIAKTCGGSLKPSCKAARNTGVEARSSNTVTRPSSSCEGKRNTSAENPAQHPSDPSPSPSEKIDCVFVQKCLVCAALILVSLAGLLLPFARFLITGWAAKRKDIMDGLNEAARTAYFEMFAPADLPNGPPQPGSVKAAFERLYTKWYGRRFFTAPGVLLVFVGLISTSLMTFTALHAVGYIGSNPLFDLPKVASAAIAGAYLWACNDLISRSRRLDFAPANVSWAALRLTIAVPMGYAFDTIAPKESGAFVAFALAHFRLPRLPP